MGPMKNVSILIAVASIVLIALTMVPALDAYRAGFALAAIVAGIALLVTISAAGGGPQTAAPAVAPAEPVKAAPMPVAANQAEAEVVSFLATLQEKGRLVDFLMDDIAVYSDAQVG